MCLTKRAALSCALGGWPDMAEELKTLEEGYESLAAALKAKQEWQRKILDVLPLAEGEALDAVVDRIKLLLWLHAEAVHEKSVAYSLMETVNQAALSAVDEARALAEKRLVAREDWKARCLAAELEVARLQRQLEFEMYGGDNFSGADALAEAVPQCAVHPEGQGAA